MDLKEINKRIRSIRGRSATLSADIHSVAVGIMEHAAAHGDVSKAGDLVEAIAVKVEREALIAWFKAFSPVIINTTTFKATQAKPNSPSFKPYDVAGAKANPYFNDGVKDVQKRLMGASDVFGALYGKLAQMEEANKEGRYVGDYTADRSAMLRAIQASGINDIDELREQTKNLKDAALAAAKREQAQVAIAQASTLKEELAA
jgi:hypothetical protein